MGLFDGGPRSAEARALTDTVVIEVSFDDVREAIQAKPEVLWVIVRLLAQRIRATDEALADACLLYTSPSPRDRQKSRMPSSA